MTLVSKTLAPSYSVTNDLKGYLWGLLGVALFSLTLPATRLAVAHLDFTFVALGRGVGAAILGVLILRFTRQPLPSRKDFASLSVVALGVVLGFPVLTAFAMRFVPASHGAVVIGLLPLATAVAGCLIAHERPSIAFWITSVTGSAVVVLYAILKGGGALQMADWGLLGAVASAAIGYAMGGKLARSLGGWQVICWALVISLPLLSLWMILARTPVNVNAPISAWGGFIYVTVISQLLGFFAWYHGLALGGIAKVGQVQLLQLFMTLFVSYALLHEQVDALTVACGTIVVIIIALGRRLQVRR